MVCDGEVDCPNAADEKSTFCAGLNICTQCMHVRVRMCSVLMCECVCECLFVQVVRTVRDSARTEALVLPEGCVFAAMAGQETTVHHVRRGEVGRRGRENERGRGRGGRHGGREGRKE